MVPRASNTRFLVKKFDLSEICTALNVSALPQFTQISFPRRLSVLGNRFRVDVNLRGENISTVAQSKGKTLKQF